MAKTASLKTIALRALKDPKSGAATRLVALRAAKPYLEPLDYEQRLRQLADTARAKVLRLLLVELTAIDAARRARAAQDESAKQQRTEVDQILRQCEAELTAEEEQARNVGAPKSTPANAAPSPSLEPLPAPPSIPDNGISKAPAQPPAAVRIPDWPDDSETKRAELLTQGRTLAAAILHQWQRVWTAPLNQQEQRRLDALQAAWVNYEREAVTHGIDVEKEFDTHLLRPPLQKFPDLAKTRRAHGVLEWNLLSLGLAGRRGQKDAEPDSGFWSSAGPGI